MTKTVNLSNAEAIRLELLRSGTMSPKQYYRETDGSVPKKIVEEAIAMTKDEYAVYLEQAIRSDEETLLINEEFLKTDDFKITKKSLFERVMLGLEPIDGRVLTEQMAKSIGAISTVFTEAPDIYNESALLSSIKEVRTKDVKSKHFIDWFFSLEDWVGHDSESFPFSMLTHGGEGFVYGYYNDDKLDSIIRIDNDGDSYFISFFCVNQALQGQGIGQHLFQYILNRFRDKELILNVYKDNTPAIHIYEKYGFKIKGVGFNIGAEPEKSHYVMQRDVTV